MTTSAGRTRYGVHPDRLRRQPASRLRSACSWLLLVTGFALAALSLIAVWANTLLLDDDAFVDRIGPLATEAEVQDEIAAVTTDGIMNALDLGIGAGVTRSAVRNVVETFLSSDTFAAIWREAIRAAHIQLKGLMTGDEEDAFVTRDGEVYLELEPIVTAVANQLVPFGIDVSSLTGVAGNIEFPILAADDLEPVQRLVRLLDRASFWCPLLAVAALLAAVGVSPHRLRAVGRLGVGLIASSGFVLLGIALTYRLYKARTADSVPDVVSDRLYERIVDPLQAAALGLMAAATVLAISAFVANLVAARLSTPVARRY